MPADQVGLGIRSIREATKRAGRRIDDDHYGTTIPFHLGDGTPPGLERFTGQRARAAGIADPSQIVALGNSASLIERIRGYAAVGVTKFVLLPLASGERALRDQVTRLCAEVLPVVENSALETAPILD